jgi:hypothetical protein
MDKKIEDMSVMELESICYRQLVLLEQTKNNIQIIQQELQKRLEREQNEQTIKKEI